MRTCVGRSNGGKQKQLWNLAGAEPGESTPVIDAAEDEAPVAVEAVPSEASLFERLAAHGLHGVPEERLDFTDLYGHREKFIPRFARDKLLAMKKILFILAALALVIWVISWFRAPAAVATSAAKQWPGEMGPLDSVFARFPPRPGNEAYAKFKALGTALPANEAVTGYVAREVARGELMIGQPPSLSDVSAMRDLLLREPIVWERRKEEVGDAQTSRMRGVLMTVARDLVAHALAKARGNDAAAWDDLLAAWNLARALEGQPQMMTQTAAMSMARMINAVAWKMPLPPPGWFAEVQGRDIVRPLLEAFQHQSASYWEDGAQAFPTKWLATSIEHDRLIAEELSSLTRCDVTARPNELGVDLTSVWRRAFRYRAEREATANALRVRGGKPIEEKSACSDGGWSFDGTTLRFSRDIPSTTSERPMPLVLKVF